jgi:hypothetical protein
MSAGVAGINNGLPEFPSALKVYNFIVIGSGKALLFWTCKVVDTSVPGLEDKTSLTGEVVILKPILAAIVFDGKTVNRVIDTTKATLSSTRSFETFFMQIVYITKKLPLQKRLAVLDNR